jgi:glycerol-3-phosphate acyltransferase PlsX
VAVIDVGAGLEATSDHLIEFAAMGLAYQKVQGIECPKVSLLNIGKEPLKGSKEVQKAYTTLKDLSQKYPYQFFLGNLEARDVFAGETDVLVTGGFTGNVFLKTSEGMAQFILSHLSSFPESLAKKLDYSRYPGAALCGVRGIVIKCHGNAGPKALSSSISSAIDWVKKDLLSHIEKEILHFFSTFR